VPNLSTTTSRTGFAQRSHVLHRYRRKRVSKRDGDGFTEFIYQGPDMPKVSASSLLQTERDESGETQVRYTMGAGLEAMRRAGNGIASGDSSFYHFDWLGSTFELTNENQAVTDEYLYNAWGEVLARTGTTENPHQYEGAPRYYIDGMSSTALLGHRHLSASTGRLLTLDPIRLDGLSGDQSIVNEVIARASPLTAGDRATAAIDGHGYRYALNRPVLLIDPEGLWCMNAVHFRQTLQWAPSVRARRSGRTWRPTHAEALLMARMSRQVDVAHPTYPHRIGNMRWHFNWMWGPDERQQLATQYKQAAIALGQFRHLCLLSAMELGIGLHPLQDTFSHDDATPWEHFPLYHRKMDNPNWDRSGWSWRAIPVPKAAQLWNYWNPLARLIGWQRGSKRIDDTEQATKDYIADWLSRTCCGTT